MSDNDHEIFGRLNSIDTTLARVDERTDRMDREWRDSRADHETRIRSLEQSEARRKGLVAGLAALASLVVNGIVALINHIAKGG